MRESERAALAQLRGLGGEPLVNQLAALFLEQTSERLSAARAAVAQRDIGAVAASAHSIRSSSAQLGARDLVAACELLEEAAESGDLPGAALELTGVTDAFDAFRAWLAEVGVRPSHTGDVGRAGPRSSSTPGATIAVVEDNVDNRLLMDAILGDMYALDEYATGTEALARMPARPPALVLLDVSLPGMDGLEVLAGIRRDAALRDVPVVAVTAHAMAGDREKYLAAGFDGYVPKPIVDERVLIDTIERLLAGRPTRAERGPRHAGKPRP
jgi:CheY-like chemotaxis protein/HPt (histidine-containing phosphotransfer) domain-containing protein